MLHTTINIRRKPTYLFFHLVVPHILGAISSRRLSRVMMRTGHTTQCHNSNASSNDANRIPCEAVLWSWNTTYTSSVMDYCNGKVQQFPILLVFLCIREAPGVEEAHVSQNPLKDITTSGIIGTETLKGRRSHHLNPE